MRDQGRTIRRHDLTDKECDALKSYFHPGRTRRANGRRAPKGIVWKIRTSSAWHDVPPNGMDRGGRSTPASGEALGGGRPPSFDRDINDKVVTPTGNCPVTG
ncbi:hypothetical protein Hesp01_03570 [Herbidospora sp. NBRC 101105]|nr:hypothetical protein Hesp01_03570 [Herbidospora sp. NBRC 101105]